MMEPIQPTIGIGFRHRTGWSPAMAAETGASGATRDPARILVVEDEFFVSVQIEEALNEAGYAVTGVAGRADEALAMCRNNRPDLVIVDIRLSGSTDGIDLAIRLRNELGLRCVFATAHADPLTRARAAAADPLGWIVKPFGPDGLLDIVAKALSMLRGH